MKVKIERDKEDCESKKYKEIGKIMKVKQKEIKEIMKVKIERDKEDYESKKQKGIKKIVKVKNIKG